MRASKEQVLATNARVGRLFGMAYCQLKEAKVIHDEWESYVTESMDFPKVNKISGAPGTGKSTIVGILAKMALKLCLSISC